MHQQKGTGQIVALCAALLLLVQAQVMPALVPDPSGTIPGPCLPSCAPGSGTFYQHAALLPVAAPAVPKELNRFQYDGPDRLLASAWQDAAHHSATAPRLSTYAYSGPGRDPHGSGRRCALLCVYRL